MKLYNKLIILLMISIAFIACEVKPEPINYGHDDCEYCKMTIMDPKFGAEVVTSKGKIYKFDAIECMLDFLHDDDFEKDEIKLYLINTFDNPGELYDGTTSYYLISPELPSPMGQFLSGYIDETSAIKMQNQKDGEIFNWETLNNRYKERFKIIN